MGSAFLFPASLRQRFVNLRLSRFKTAAFGVYFPTLLALFSRNDTMIRKYWWLVVFAISVLIFDALLMQWIELMSTETDKCRNMNSVNPLKLVNCSELD